MTNMSIKMGFAKVRKILLFVFLTALVFSGGYYVGVQGFKAEVTKSLHVNIDRQTPPPIKTWTFHFSGKFGIR